MIGVGSGSPPWLGLILAACFGVYGLLKKTIPLPATAGLTAESLVVAPLAVAYIVALQATGHGTFTDHGGRLRPGLGGLAIFTADLLRTTHTAANGTFAH